MNTSSTRLQRFRFTSLALSLGTIAVLATGCASPEEDSEAEGGGQAVTARPTKINDGIYDGWNITTRFSGGQHDQSADIDFLKSGATPERVRCNGKVDLVREGANLFEMLNGSFESHHWVSLQNPGACKVVFEGRNDSPTLISVSGSLGGETYADPGAPDVLTRRERNSLVGTYTDGTTTLTVASSDEDGLFKFSLTKGGTNLASNVTPQLIAGTTADVVAKLADGCRVGLRFARRTNGSRYDARFSAFELFTPEGGTTCPASLNSTLRQANAAE